VCRSPRLVVPMHYRTDAVNFLEPPDSFLAAVEGRVDRLDANEAAADALLGARGEPTVALFAPPLP
jgi:L-ascorbate metabolism protein UlaG (beta-lactamase superfamily)